MIKKIILFSLIVGILLLAGCQSSDVDKAEKLVQYQAEKNNDLTPSGKIVDGKREITITGTRFFWEPKQIVVNKGDLVRLTIKSADIPHGFEIEGLDIPNFDTNQQIVKGKPVTAEFEAKEQGSWDILCTIYCGGGHGSMKGRFIIK